ncbi:MAG: alpha/beta hydrolase [Burkholderiales bacterium]|nr:alpha/beta hydrolase [Burkholderiales bacterium]
MSLDLQIRGLLEAIKAKGAKHFEDMSPAEARLAAGSFVKLQGAGQAVAEVSDHLVPVTGGQIPVRIYKPAASGSHPVLFHYHGGGFVIGDIHLLDAVSRQLCNVSQAAVVAVGYRKAPEHRFPTAAEDAYSALLWTVSHAERLGLNAKKLVVLGDSAGGNLATVVSQLARDRAGPPIAAQVLIYPLVDIHGTYESYEKFGDGYFLTTRTMAWFADQYVPEPDMRKHPMVSPLYANLQGLPPALIVSAGYDPLCDQNAAYADALERAGVHVAHWENPSMIHGFFWMGGVIEHTSNVMMNIGFHIQKHWARC